MEEMTILPKTWFVGNFDVQTESLFLVSSLQDVRSVGTLRMVDATVQVLFLWFYSARTIPFWLLMTWSLNLIRIVLSLRSLSCCLLEKVLVPNVKWRDAWEFSVAAMFWSFLLFVLLFPVLWYLPVLGQCKALQRSPETVVWTPISAIPRHSGNSQSTTWPGTPAPFSFVLVCGVDLQRHPGVLFSLERFPWCVLWSQSVCFFHEVKFYISFIQLFADRMSMTVLNVIFDQNKRWEFNWWICSWRSCVAGWARW